MSAASPATVQRLTSRKDSTAAASTIPAKTSGMPGMPGITVPTTPTRISAAASA